MRAARITVSLFLVLTIGAWTLYVLYCSLWALLAGFHVYNRSEMHAWLVSLGLNYFGVIAAYVHCRKNIRFLNLFVAILGSGASVLLTWAMWSHVSLPKQFLWSLFPALAGLIIAGGFFFLRATRDHPSLQSRADEE